MDHDTLVIRSCDLTGPSPRTKVCPNDPIQDRGHDMACRSFRPSEFEARGVSKALIATLLFDPSMSGLPIIVKQNSPSGSCRVLVVVRRL